MTIIELAGAPGAGKTTMVPEVQEACRVAELTPYTTVEAARPFAARTLLGRTVAILPKEARRAALWGVFRLHSAGHSVRFVLQRRSLVSLVFRSQPRRPAESDSRRRRVLYWWYRMAGAHQFVQAHGKSGEALILDEGFVHRAVQIFASAVERPEAAAVAAYVDLVPPPDLLIHVAAPADVCRHRVRGAASGRGCSTAVLLRSTGSSKTLTTRSSLPWQQRGSRGWQVIEVANGDLDSASAAAELRCRLAGDVLIGAARA